MHAALLVTLALVCAEPLRADIIFRDAHIHDGTGSPPLTGSVAIQGDRIVAVGDVIVAAGAREINCSGLVVAPGFIDLHNHSDEPISKPETRLNQNFLTQGVTTIVTGNCGGGRADVGAYLAEIDRTGAGTHVAHLIPQGAIRRQVVGGQNRPASPAELEQMKQLVAQGMREGAWGMSTGLIYTPSKYADTAELVELARVVAEQGGIYVSHLRNEGTGLLEAIDEALAIGSRGGLPVHISHFKVSGRGAWGLAAEAIRKVDDARQAGQRVTADQYPYIASSTSLAAMVVPDEFRSQAEFQAALSNDATAAKLRAELERALAARDGGASLFIASYPPTPAWQGRDLASLAREQSREVVDLVIEIQSRGGASMVHFGMNEEEVRLIMRQPYVATASDGGAKVPNDTVPHPRNYGTFPRKIGLYAIEGQIISLAQAIHSASGLPADILGMKDRGYLKPGLIADVVVFDPASFRDAATYDQPHQYAPGVRYLLVAGQFAIDEGQVTSRLAGRAVRRVPATDNPDVP